MGWAERLARHPWLAALGVAAAAAAALPFAARLEVDNTIEAWLDPDRPAYRAYQEFRAEFGSEEFLLVVYDRPERLDDDFLLELTDLRLDLEEIPGVRLAVDPSSLRAKFFSAGGAASFERELLGSPLYRDFLVSRDGRRAATWLSLAIERPADRARIVEQVEAVAARRWSDREVHLAGPPVVNAALDRTSRRNARTLFPLVFLLSAVVLLVRFRSFGVLLVPSISVGAGVTMALGILRLKGGSLDMVTAALPSVLWVLGLSSSVHLLASYRRRPATEPRRVRAAAAMAEVARPCLFSAVTTALGFLALLASEMQPVREMGLSAAIGVLLCLVSNFALFPLLCRLAPGSGAPRPAVGRVARWAAALTRKPAPVVAIAAALAVTALAAVSQLRAESNVIEFFPETAPIRHTYREVLPQLTGSFSLEVLLTPPDRALNLARLEELERLEGLLAAVPGVAKTLSAADLVKKTHQVSTGAPPQSWRLPANEEELELAWQMAGESLADELALFLGPGGETWRISVLARPMASEAHRRLVTTVRELLAREVDPEWQAAVTGIVDLLVEMQTGLVRSQIRSFALAFLLIAPLIALLLRSPRYGALSLAPNLMPIVVVLGVMGALAIPLDPATVMIAAMALGIAVDDTLHFLARYQVERPAADGPRRAVDATLAAVAEPMADTTLVAAAGFLVLTAASFLPLVYFGALTALTLVTALAADLLLLPALLLLFDRGRGA